MNINSSAHIASGDVAYRFLAPMESISLLTASQILASKETRMSLFSEIINAVAYRVLNEAQLQSEIALKIKDSLENKQISPNQAVSILPQILEILKKSAAQIPFIYQFEEQTITEIKLNTILSLHSKPHTKDTSQKIEDIKLAAEAQNIAHPSRAVVIKRISEVFANKIFSSNEIYKQVQTTLKTLVEEKKITRFEQLPYQITLFEALKKCAQVTPQTQSKL